MACPEVESAVHTMPAMVITKNMPVVPESPNRNSTTDEMMMVSMVMPETGLRAVVAMALAATEVKKNEKSSVSARPTRIAAGEAARLPSKMATPMALTITPISIASMEMSRSVRSKPASPAALASWPRRNARAAMANDPATIVAAPECARRDGERSGHHAHGFQNAEDAGRGDGAHAHEPHVAAENLCGGHLRDGDLGRIYRGVADVAADHPNQRH